MIAAARPDFDRRRIGGSLAAAILGVSEYSTPFDGWLYLTQGFALPPTNAMRWGKRFERAIADAWAEEAGVELAWFDEPITHPTREWQRFAPDVRVLTRPGEIADIKRERWALDRHGPPGTDEIARYELVQLQTYLEALHSMGEPAELGRLVVHDLAHDELFTWQTRRDPDFGALIVEECERFWRDHVLTSKPPEMSGSETARRWLEKRFPKDTTPPRAATSHEAELAREWRDIAAAQKSLGARVDVLKNLLRESIGEARGIRGDFGTISFAAIAEQVGTDWEAVARALAKDLLDNDVFLPGQAITSVEEILAIKAANHQRVERGAHRKLSPYFKTEK